MIALWKGKNHIYFGVIRSKVFFPCIAEILVTMGFSCYIAEILVTMDFSCYIAEVLVTMVFSCYIAEILVTMELLAHGRWFSPGTPASSTI